MLFLFSVLGASLNANSSSASTSEAVKTESKVSSESNGMDVDEDDDQEAPVDDKMASIIGAIEAIFSLVRNTRIANRAYVSAAAVGLFVRLSCFGPGCTQLPVEPKTPKKKSKKDDSAAAAALTGLHGLNKDIIVAIKLVEGPSDSTSSSSGNGHSHFHVPSEIAELAGSKLMALLADTGSISLSLLAVPAPVAAVSTDGKKWKGEKIQETPLSDGTHLTTLMDLAVASVNYLSSTGGLPLLRASEESEDEDDEESEGGEALTAFNSVLVSMKSLCPSSANSLSLMDGGAEVLKAQKTKSSGASEVASEGTTDSDSSKISNEGAARKLRLRESFHCLLGHSLFHTLTSSDVSLQALLDIATVSVRIVAESDSESSSSSSGSGSSSSSSSSSSGATDVAVSSKASKKVAKSGSDEDDDDEDDEDEEERPQSILFDASMELLSVTGDHVVKGVRDAIKKVWNSLCQVRVHPSPSPPIPSPSPFPSLTTSCAFSTSSTSQPLSLRYLYQ